MQSRLTRNISLTIATVGALVGTLNFINLSAFLSVPLWDAVLSLEVWTLFAFTVFFGFSRWMRETWLQGFQAGLILFLSGPLVLTSTYSFIGFWFFVLGITLVYKYGFLKRGGVWKLIATLIWFLPWLAFSVVTNEGLKGSALRSVNYGIFLLSCLVFLYFIFEEEIRDLLRSNRSKDAELTEKEAEIARLVPLSVLGEQVAHVAHSFKNNLSLIGLARLQLEEGGDLFKASQKLDEFSQSMHERIDNILMVSQAGATREPEVFDAARVLAGLNQVYLTEPAFLNRAAIELEANEPTPVLAVRWDFLLMAENILKNALEALTAKGGHGTIRITLKDRLLTLANDGGAMEQCSNCRESCLDCSRYGHPGQTTKKTGSGHGLAQVFATCRKYGWTLRIRTRDDWTFFEIGLTAVTK